MKDLSLTEKYCQYLQTMCSQASKHKQKGAVMLLLFLFQHRGLTHCVWNWEFPTNQENTIWVNNSSSNGSSLPSLYLQTKCVCVCVCGNYILCSPYGNPEVSKVVRVHGWSSEGFQIPLLQKPHDGQGSSPVPTLWAHLVRKNLRKF